MRIAFLARDRQFGSRGIPENVLPFVDAGQMIAAYQESFALDLAAIAHFLEQRGLMVQKIPEQLEVVDEIPRNPTGKILKHELRERFGA